MISVDLDEGIVLAAWTTALYVLAGAAAAWLWFSYPEPALPSAEQGVRLCQVNPGKDDFNTDIDIIAIHGLDTKSPDTWTWRAKNPKDNVNWLADPQMLPSMVGAARIFTCNWPADLLQPSDLVQKRIEEYALLLLDAIDRELSMAGGAGRECRRIFFIASCLGGIVLARALVNAGDKYFPLRKATHGIVFLATPFRGTSFRDVAALAEPGLKFWASIQGREVTKLLGEVKGSTFNLETLVRDFTRLCLDKNHPFLVFTFYEKGKTSLPLKVLPWVPRFFRQEKQLVDENSATLDIVQQPLPLDRRHVMMNKFNSPRCADYKAVAGKIQEFLGKIRQGTPLMQADVWIRTQHYTPDNLTIERLSGDSLPMDQCYINLAIIEQHRSEEDSKTQSSPFSLSARLKVESVDKDMQVELSTLFGPRQRGAFETNPRRILIRGRAGVGKTTLCKKIVHEFTHGTWGQWKELFDRILWVPLRNLKLEERCHAKYHFVDLFNHEYFSDAPLNPDLASALSDTLESTKGSRILFLLDGLDEVSQDLGDGSAMFRFLKKLLDQPNVIITSRPSGKLPPGLKAIDIELETIGFYPDQVNEYLERVLTPKETKGIQSFLSDRPLVQDLVRIPVQLDAFGFTWNERVTKLDTMTAVYQAIEGGLWKKDVLRLGKRDDGTRLTKDLIQDSDPSMINNLVKDEICFLEGFAFTGLHNDVIDFESRHQNAICIHFSPTITVPAKTLPHLSFLRTSNLKKGQGTPSYHFLHLTYQEFFAARYFVRQWQAGEPLKCLVLSNEKLEELGTIDFLRKHKYTARYDIFWRFVSGLLDAKGNVEEFFKAIEDTPRDLLGPTHQRLVMHCLSESSMETPLRRSLENILKEWLLYECEVTKQPQLASEVEFPERSLADALQEAPPDVKREILRSLTKRPTLPSSIVKIIISWLRDGQSESSKEEVLRILYRCKYHSARGLSEDLLTAVMKLALYKNGGSFVRMAAMDVLKAQPSISDERLTAVMELALCREEDKSVRRTAIKVLKAQPSISDERLTAVMELALCRKEDNYVRETAINILKAQPSISDERLTTVLELALQKDEDSPVRMTALELLSIQLSISDERFTALVELAFSRNEQRHVRTSAFRLLLDHPSILDEYFPRVVALLEDKEGYMREAALEILKEQPSIPDEYLTAVVGLLKDKEYYVRLEALMVLEAQASISDKYITAVVALLEDEEEAIRQAALGVLQAQPSISDERLTAVVALLKDWDEPVRCAALRILQLQPSISDECLAAVVELLKHERHYEKLHVLEILQAQPCLSDEHLKAVVALLEDMSDDVQEAASKILQAQTRLSDNHLKAVSLLLDSRTTTGDRAEAVLRGYKEFYCTLFNGPSAGSLLKIFLSRSFKEQCSWYIEDGALCVNAPDGIRNVSIDDMETFRDIVEKSRPPGYPLVAREDMQRG